MIRRIGLILALIIVLIGAVGPALAQGGETVYVIKQGDTLFSIAKRYGVNLSLLASRNGITNPALIYVGQQLIIPSGTTTTPTTTTTTTTTITTTTSTTGTSRTHVVQPGENLYRISLKYGVTMAALAAANGIYDISRIYAGQRLIIPAGGTSVPVYTPPSQPVVAGPVPVVPAGSSTVFTLNGAPIAQGSMPRPNNFSDSGAFEARRDAFLQVTAFAQNNLVSLQVSRIRYSPYWVTMSLTLRNQGVTPAIAGGRYKPGTSTPWGLIGSATGSGGIPVPQVTGPWGFNVHLSDGRTVTAYAGCRHANPSMFDCGTASYQVNPATDLGVGGSASSELWVYFLTPWTAPDPSVPGTGYHIVSMDLFAYYPDGRQTGTLLHIDMP